MSMRFFLVFFLFFSLVYSSVEDQIIIIENFLSKKEAKTLIDFYLGSQNKLQVSSDNQLSFSSITDSKIRHILFNLSSNILERMALIASANNKRYFLDHGGIYARIPGNFCPYHADNCYFFCPIHGDNQSYLRNHCPGDCPGSHFRPNHTYWREYTALLYLNEDFEGGQIVFEDGPHNVLYRKTIQVRQGMLILAPNGSHFYHEVLPIRKGVRYSIHFWYTSDPSHAISL